MNFISKSQTEFEQLYFLRKYLENHKGFIAGGCFKDIFQDKEVRDIDIFFITLEDALEAIASYTNNSDFKLLYENKNATGFTEVSTGRTIELVIARFGTPLEVLKQFDFSISKFSLGTSIWKDDLLAKPRKLYECIYSEDFFTDLARKRLVFDYNILHAGFSLERTIKYARYGFKMDRVNTNLLVEAIFNQGRAKVLDEVNSNNLAEGY